MLLPLQLICIDYTGRVCPCSSSGGAPPPAPLPSAPLSLQASLDSELTHLPPCFVLLLCSAGVAATLLAAPMRMHVGMCPRGGMALPLCLQDALTRAGIRPSDSKVYPVQDIKDALEDAYGVMPHVTCDNRGALSEVRGPTSRAGGPSLPAVGTAWRRCCCLAQCIEPGLVHMRSFALVRPQAARRRDRAGHWRHLQSPPLAFLCCQHGW